MIGAWGLYINENIPRLLLTLLYDIQAYFVDITQFSISTSAWRPDPCESIIYPF